MLQRQALTTPLPDEPTGEMLRRGKGNGFGSHSKLTAWVAPLPSLQNTLRGIK